MAGLELLYTSVVSNISSPQDALVCFVHWEIVRHGYKCLGTGDQPQQSDKKSELLPSGWNDSKEVYTLRYQSKNEKSNLLLKAITVESTLLFNVMDSATERVSDLTVNFSDYVDSGNLQEFDSVFKNTEELAKKVKSKLLPSDPSHKGESSKKVEKRHLRESTEEILPDKDPLLIPPRNPQTGRQPYWSDPMAPFAAGGADLDPFGGRAGGMIMDPLRSGFPRSGFDPSAGIPGRLPPGAVPPGARFDPFGPVGQNRPGPDPDHMPPPGYDDMFM
ncbi:proteasome inhibitor PI31 subunit [Megalops cyprinoides]|uniref:proteasome inhibitor PI31 subunit n=1 Tax=Megalops cyprinoides TaxID=118141 RepID=UPI0018647F18|nr:proteasome inhibitor PI31 subunit [Megalops cyprinoides]